MKEQLELKEIVGYLPYGLKCQYEGIINGREISKHRKEFEQDGNTFCNWEYFEPIEEIKGLKVAPLKTIRKYKNYWVATCGIYNNGQKGFYNGFGMEPILFPISSLTEFLREIYQEYNYSLLAIKEMPYATIVAYQLMGETFKDIVYSQGSFNCCPMDVFNKLLEKKLDVYNLIEKGLAIAVTEDFNPYK
jgi:hypothetical protein